MDIYIWWRLTTTGKLSRSAVDLEQIVESWNDRSAIKDWSVHLDGVDSLANIDGSTTAALHAETDRDVKHSAYMSCRVCCYKVGGKKQKLQILSHVHKPEGWIFNSSHLSIVSSLGVSRDSRFYVA